MNTKQAAERILELDKEATPGPWEIANYTNYSGYSIWSNKEGCIAERWEPSTEFNREHHKGIADFIAQSRTLAPFIAAKYLEALVLLKELAPQKSEDGTSTFRIFSEDLFGRLEEFLNQQEKE